MPDTATRWLKANLAISTAALALVSAVAGGLISVTLFYADITHSEHAHTAEIASIHLDMLSVDGRLNALDKRLSLQEAQLKWAGEHIGSRK